MKEQLQERKELLQIREVTKIFGGGTVNEKTALNSVNLTLQEGDFVTVIGNNGAGKSTLLNCIAGVYGIDKGSIILDGKDITKLPEHKRARWMGRVLRTDIDDKFILAKQFHFLLYEIAIGIKRILESIVRLFIILK